MTRGSVPLPRHVEPVCSADYSGVRAAERVAQFHQQRILSETCRQAAQVAVNSF